jgi:hypothetical protein
VINALKLEKMCRSEIIGYVIQINNMQQQDIENTTLSDGSKITAILKEFEDVFSAHTRLPPSRSCDHTIPLKEGSKPPNLRPCRVPYKQKDEVEKLIQSMLHDVVIMPSNNPYSSPAILVRKKDGSWHMCIDYIEFNNQTIKNKFPISVIEDLLDELCGAQIFTKLDLKSGYHQIRIRESDIHKTAFGTYFGHFEFFVMPFGLTNLPATFEALMNSVFEPYLRKFVLVFFDDILIDNKTMSEHLEHLRIVLQLLRENSLTTKESKCTFASSQVEYLGHIINGQGVATDPTKIEAIKGWSTSKTVTQ